MTNVVDLELVWANAGGQLDPGNTKYELGWIAEIPTFQNFNYVLSNLDKAKLSYAEKDIHLWNSQIEYVPGARVERADKTYYCITANTDEDPELDVTNSYWVNGLVFSSVPNSFSMLEAKEGLKLDQLKPRSSASTWEGNDITINNLNSVIALRNTGATDNLLVGNINGKLTVVNVENTTSPDGRSMTQGVANKSYEVFHEGHKPTQAEVAGTIPEAPTTGKSYARVGSSNSWVGVTTTTVQTAPPPPVLGAGQGWYNLDDGRFYIDINDGSSSQWVPASPPVVADLSPLEQRIADVNNAFVGMESFYPPRAGGGVHPAWVQKAGGTFSRAAYPNLYNWANSHGLVVTEAQWQAIKAASPNGSVSVYSAGNGATTFRTPDVGEEGGFARALKGVSVAPIGNIDGGFDSQSAVVSGTNETSPRGSYQRVYIFTGNIVENLPTPTPAWLVQQDVNTNKIADLEARIIALEAYHP